MNSTIYIYLTSVGGSAAVNTTIRKNSRAFNDLNRNRAKPLRTFERKHIVNRTRNELIIITYTMSELLIYFENRALLSIHNYVQWPHLEELSPGDDPVHGERSADEGGHVMHIVASNSVV